MYEATQQKRARMNRLKLTPDETVRLARMKDDPELKAQLVMIAKRLEALPHSTLCNMFAGFILGGAPSYNEAVQATERMIVFVRHGLDEEKEPS